MAGSPVFSINFTNRKKTSKGKFLLFVPNSYLSHDRDISILSRNYPTLSKGNIMLFDFNWNCAQYLKTIFFFCNLIQPMHYWNAVAIWPVTGQGFQNTKWPAVRYLTTFLFCNQSLSVVTERKF